MKWHQWILVWAEVLLQRENPQNWGLTKFFTFADFPHVWQFADLRFADPIFFAICGFAICWPKFVADLKLLQICKFFIFLLINTYLKCLNPSFYIKNSAKKTCSSLLDSSAIEGGNFKKCLILSVFWWKICGFAICELAHQFGDETQQNLRTHISQKFADLWLRIEPKNFQI